jgi:hypothetical protein
LNGLSSCQIQNIYSNGSGVIFSSTSSTVGYSVIFTIFGYNINNVSVPSALKGGLIYVTNSTQTISLSALSISSVSTNNSNTEGGILNVGKASSVSVSNVNISDCKAKIGGAFHISGCVTSISSCRFSSVESNNGPGGAIYFGENSGFSISNSAFSNCVSTGGRGGAIAINSSQKNTKSIINSNFTNNLGGNENKGNDFCDISNNANVTGVYTAIMFSNLVSSSVPIRFYHDSLNANLDCVLNYTCYSSEVYVNSSETSVNNIFCGNNSNPCLDVEYAWSERVYANGTILIMNGEHGIIPRTFGVSFNISIKGTQTDSNMYPKLYPSQYSAKWFFLYSEPVSMILSFEKVNFVLPTQGFGGVFFSTYYTPHAINIISCIVSSNSTNTAFTNHTFYLDLGLT